MQAIKNFEQDLIKNMARIALFWQNDQGEKYALGMLYNFAISRS